MNNSGSHECGAPHRIPDSRKLDALACELPESCVESLRIWACSSHWRYPQRAVVHFFDAVLKHWTVFFGKDVRSDMDGVVGVDANDIDVVGRVVDLAQTQPVGDRR